MTDSPIAIIGAALLGAVTIGGLLVVLGDGDVSAFTDSAAAVAGPVLIIAAVLTGVTVLKN